VVIPNLTIEGKCFKCEKWIELKKRYGHTCGLLKHEGKKSEGNCPNSGYSANKHRYVVKTNKEALVLAKFIKNDDGGCLRGSHGHTVACGDGDHCNSEKLRLSRALAVYFLKQYKENAKKA